MTAEFTVRDLLSQRSGLAGAAGDSMIGLNPVVLAGMVVIHNLRYLTPLTSFRANYAYSNVLYITAAELVARVAAKPWHEFVAERIFQPLQMQCLRSVPIARGRPTKNLWRFYRITGLPAQCATSITGKPNFLSHLF
ncbi:serine hydrolase [Alishewanella longhuensis]